MQEKFKKVPWHKILSDDNLEPFLMYVAYYTLPIITLFKSSMSIRQELLMFIGQNYDKTHLYAL